MAKAAIQNDPDQLAKLFCAGLDGDKVAYQQFLLALIPVLRGRTRRKLPDPDVEDVVQEILISVHKARHTYDGKRPVMPWVMAIARYRIANHLRKMYSRKAHQLLDIDDLKETLADVTNPAPGNEVGEELLSGVPEREQKILTLMHVQGFTAKETGEQLGMKESAVKVAALRAIKKIRLRLDT